MSARQAKLIELRKRIRELEESKSPLRSNEYAQELRTLRERYEKLRRGRV